jgi:hypothetical protein
MQKKSRKKMPLYGGPITQYEEYAIFDERGTTTRTPEDRCRKSELPTGPGGHGADEEPLCAVARAQSQLR